jgi:hypothetical protein
MESGSSKSLGGTAVAAAHPSSCGSVELSATAPPCQKRPIGGNFRSDREPSGESRPRSGLEDKGYPATAGQSARSIPDCLDSVAAGNLLEKDKLGV